jgi:hypothetical protein
MSAEYLGFLNEANFFASFGEVPGSRWAELAVLKTYARPDRR